MRIPKWPDWCVVLAKPEVRKAVKRGRGYDSLDPAEARTARALHAYLTKDRDGKPLQGSEKLARIEKLSVRHARAAKRVLAYHLWRQIEGLGFQLVDGRAIRFRNFCTPQAVHSATRKLRIEVTSEWLGDEVRRDRPDIATHLLRKWAEDTRQVVDDPRTFPQAKERFQQQLEELEGHIRFLQTRPLYLGRGRRAEFDPQQILLFVTRLAEWLQGRRPKKERSAQKRAFVETSAFLGQLCEEFGLGSRSPTAHEVEGVLHARRRPDAWASAVKFAAACFEVTPQTIRRYAKRTPP